MFVLILLAIVSPAKAETWTVDGVQRVAYIQSPQPSKQTAGPTPIIGSIRKVTDGEEASPPPQVKPAVVFVFHGHGGNGRNMSRKDFASHWPEAYFVFPDGLLTKSYYDPEGKRSGWQQSAQANEGRDLKFFDAMLATMLNRGADPQRVYVTGHSNGGFFSYLLWAERHDKLAAIASSAGGGPRASQLQPLPAMHLAGRSDTIVSFAAQARTMDLIRRVNRCEKESHPLEGIGDEYPSKLKTPFVSYIYSAGHEFQTDAPERIVGFFRLHTRPAEGYPSAEPIAGGDGFDRFSQFDLNSDGKIDAEELNRPLLFRVLDKDGDGAISRSEAEATLGKL